MISFHLHDDDDDYDDALLKKKGIQFEKKNIEKYKTKNKQTNYKMNECKRIVHQFVIM